MSAFSRQTGRSGLQVLVAAVAEPTSCLCSRRALHALGLPDMPLHPDHLCHVQNWQASEGFCLRSTCLSDRNSPLSLLQTLSFPYLGTQAPLSSQWCLVPVWDHMSHRPQLPSLRSPKIFPLPPQEAGKGSTDIGQCKVATWCPMWVPAADAFGRRLGRREREGFLFPWSSSYGIRAY